MPTAVQRLMGREGGEGGDTDGENELWSLKSSARRKIDISV